MKDSEVYDLAAKEVAKGWIRHEIGPWIKDEGRVCAVGAIRRVLYQTHTYTHEDLRDRADELAQGLLPMLREQYPMPESARSVLYSRWQSMEHWNDDSERTADEVVAMFEKARAQAAEEGR